MQRALTVFHTEFNKFASEELPRCDGSYQLSVFSCQLSGINRQSQELEQSAENQEY